jgi:hypothetical protein
MSSYLCTNVAVPTKMHGMDKVDAQLPTEARKDTLSSQEAHLTLQRTTVQCLWGSPPTA